MRVGLIVHSETGNTHSVAVKLKARLADAGHDANVERVEAVGDVSPRATDAKLGTIPSVEDYDAVVFGAPVHAFSLSPVMQSYLSQLSPLDGKHVACLVTQFFPFRWMGGRRAVRQMRKACQAKGGKVCGSGIVNWSSPRRVQTIARVVDELARCFPS